MFPKPSGGGSRRTHSVSALLLVTIADETGTMTQKQRRKAAVELMKPLFDATDTLRADLRLAGVCIKVGHVTVTVT